MHLPRCRIGFDIGGTFTDFVLLEQTTDRLHVHKLLTTSADPAAGSIAGLDALVEKAGMGFANVDEVVHGTTIVTNAVIERRGAPTALLTTKGFRDILEMGTEQRYDIHDLFLRFPEPLVPRRLRFEVDERIAADGTVVAAIDRAEIRAQLAKAVEAGATSVAVCFLHAYRNHAHERVVAEVAAEHFPGLPLSLSSEVCAEIREYDRTATSCANAYVMPLVAPYIARLEAALRERGFAGQFLLMQSSGELASVAMACRFPVRLLESGPAGGAIAAGLFGRAAGRDNVIAFDMGGTTAKICLVEDGKADVAPMLEAAREDRFKRGSGIPIRAPVVDMIEIGAGGGSIAGFDELGLLRIGPRSAGSAPGPACYGLGGGDATVTDANLALGYLAPDSFLGGRMALDVDAARRALVPVAARLGGDAVEAAWGIFAVVCENMAGAARAHVVEKGRDPRDFAMVAFGGAGPAHAVQVARGLGVREVIVPPASGAASALGFLGGRLGHDGVRSAPSPLSRVDWAATTTLVGDLEAEGRTLLEAAGIDASTLEVRREVELRLAGQVHNLRVAVRAGPLDPGAAAEIAGAFASAYRVLYARDPAGGEVEVISWRVRTLAPAPAQGAFSLARRVSGREPLKAYREIWVPVARRFERAPVYDRYAMPPGLEVAGPAVVEEDESTTVIQPGDRLRVDGAGNLVVAVGESAPRRAVLGGLALPEAVAAIERDPVGLEIMWSRLITISEECWLTVIRTAFSLIIGEMQDFACEILDAEGESLAHSPRAMPVFNLTLMAAVKSLLKVFPSETLKPGDVLVTNDPWLCAGHLFDVAVVTPVFHGGRVVALVGSIGHVSDIGGTKDRNRAREIYEEGFQIPPMKLYRAGAPNEDLFTLLGKNVRNREQVFGDLAALVAANAVGAERLAAFLVEYGLDDLRGLASVIQARAEAAMREAIRAVPDGTYTSEVWPLSVGLRQRFPVSVRVAGERIDVDYAGAPSELGQGGLNCTLNFTEAKTFFALKCLLTPHIRASAGCYRTLGVTAPPGTMLNCSEGTSVGIRHLTGSYLVGNIFNAFAEAMPRGVQAFSGLPAILHFYGREGGRTYSDHIYIGGGQGGSVGADGKSGMLWPTSASNGSVEVLETRAPILILEKAYVPDSGGVGRYRGGLGQRMRVRRLNEDGGRTIVNSYPEGIGFTGHALFGGEPGGGAHTVMRDPAGTIVKDNGEGAVETLTRIAEIVEVRVGGGAGYGDPRERPVAAVQADLDGGYITADAVRASYRCVVDDAGRAARTRADTTGRMPQPMHEREEA